MKSVETTVYRIHEIFYSIEGEGGRVGEPTIFVRLSGCNLQCPWCDTSEHPHIQYRYYAPEVVGHCQKQGWPGRWVCLTGGEPMMQDVVVLCRCFQAAGFRVHLETNGTYPIPSGVFDYVTVSPKIQSDVHHVHAPFLEENEAVADEFKYVISRAEDLQLVRWGRQVFLQPNCEIPAARRLCVNAVMDHPGWRLSLQIHKHLGLP